MKKYLLLLLLFCLTNNLSAQERTLTGILEDNGDPLLFATVAIYRNDVLIRGVETNIEGYYSILCMVGDRIEFSYIGYAPKSTIVTEAMLSGPGSVQKIKIERIKSKAFKQKMKDRKLKASKIYDKPATSLNSSATLPNKHALNQKITGFSVKDGKVLLSKPKTEIEYDLKITQNIGLRSIFPWHQHQLQNTYSQGRPLNGILEYRDHTTEESHSYGPRISTLSDLDVHAHDNSLHQPSLTSGTSIFFEAERKDQKIYSHFSHNTFKDIFNQYPTKETNLRLGYINFDDFDRANILNIDLNINRTTMGNHNFNGYYQKVLQAMMVQSPSFDSKGLSSENNESFNSKFNHPQWFLDNNDNPISSDDINLIIDHKWKSKNSKSEMSNLLNLSYKKTKIAEHIHESTIGADDNISRYFNANIPSALLVTKLKRKRFRSNHITLELDNLAALAKTDFLGKENNTTTYDLSNNILRNTVTPRAVFQKEKFKVAASNSSLLANNQPNSLINPAVYFSYDFNFRKKRIHKLRPYIAVTRTTKEQDLLLDRYNYSSFLFNHHELQSQRLNVPLWLPDNLKNEIKDEFKIGIIAAKRYSRSTLTSTIEYQYLPQWNVIFPVQENGQFVLKNAADYTTHQISWKSNWYGSKYIWGRSIYVNNSFEVSHFNTKVNKLHTSSNRIPIAGFSDISKNLIEGQPVGIIIGTDYEKTFDGDVIISSDGFPSKAKNLKIIADPTPILNFKYDLELHVDHFSFKILFDGQLGGKVWDGTQQTLDYYGVSQHSAEQRIIDNYVFEGVQSDGSKNTKQVALADPHLGLDGNQWTRYGESGIASEYIKSASHLSLKSIELSYWNKKYGPSQFQLTLYAKNVLTLASFDGFSTSHLYEDNMSYGLQYFNQPIATEIGSSLTYNF